MSSEVHARVRRGVAALGIALFVSGLAVAPGPVAAVDPPSGTAGEIDHRVLDVSAGQYHSCVIRTDGSLACWGWMHEPPPGGTYVAVSAGAESTCAIRTDGTLRCWGQIGDIVPEGTFTEVGVAVADACAIRTDGTLACWFNPDYYGYDEDDPDGEGDAAGQDPPAGTFTALSVSDQYSCAIRTSGLLACWGRDESDVPNLPTGKFLAVSVSLEQACALRINKTLACWGGEYPEAGKFTAVSTAGWGTVCAIRSSGTLACWGANDSGQATPPDGTFTAVSAAENHACGIRTDGTLACWGYEELATPTPTAFMGSLKPWLSTSKVALQWTASPLFAPVTSYDIGYRRARWNSWGFGDTVTWRTGVEGASATFTASPGYTYCYSVRAHDADGLVSGWAWETCTAIPLDDRSLRRSAGWTALTGAKYFGSTALRSSTYGARLTRTGVYGTALALLATTCPTCGTVKVYLDGELLRKISLHSDTRVDRRLIRITDDDSLAGTITIKVVTSGKPVVIDGLAVHTSE